MDSTQELPIPHCNGCGNQLAEFAGPGKNRGLVCLTPGCDLQDVDMEPTEFEMETPKPQLPSDRTSIPLLPPARVAHRLQVSVAWVRDHSSRKYPRLPVVRVGGLLRYDPADIDHWIQDLRAAGSRKAS